ncbi:hypothetical protein C2E23DRAFT_805249 [Lenzites betulinus]|nr:hypothetical protein C2E23DRAFT_805249 [Lenzites betulinus]
MRYAAKASVLPTPEPVQLKRMAKGCFVAVRHRVGSRRLSRLDELRAQGFTVYDWDGVTTQAILDGADRIVGVLAGRPEDPAWDGVVREANIAMHRARRRCRFRRPDVAHRRGSYPTLARGVSFGGGQRAPRGLKNSAGNASALSDLCADPAMRRIAGFGNHILATSSATTPDLRRPFNTSMYPAASFNFGPNSVCFEHTDSLNDPCNWIHITALGTFNPDKGGHLILYDLRLVIRFPPGSSILFPSALLRHGNLAVAGHEHRMSFTQYCAGGLMRWVACGGQTVASLKKNDPAGYAAYQASLSKRAGQCMARFSTPASLLQDIKGSGSN